VKGQEKEEKMREDGKRKGRGKVKEENGKM